MTRIMQICVPQNIKDMSKKLSIILSVIFLPILLCAQIPQKETRIFAVKDGQELKMDIYTPITTDIDTKKPCLIFVFGGGFKEGTRDAKQYTDYFNYFANREFVVVSIDYRLGMKGQKAPSPFNTRPLRNAIEMGVSDLYSATNYILENVDKWDIDRERIIISGSSAGAIIVLQSDYELNDFRHSARVLPEGFRYAGVISFAGAIFSIEGVPSYTRRPAPTLFFHGSADRLVPYNSVRFFRLGMFGSKPLAQRFRQQSYPYLFYTKEGIGHEVANYPMTESLSEIEQFINDFVFNRSQLMIDINIKDRFRQSDTSLNPANFFH